MNYIIIGEFPTTWSDMPRHAAIVPAACVEFPRHATMGCREFPQVPARFQLSIVCSHVGQRAPHLGCRERPLAPTLVAATCRECPRVPASAREMSPESNIIRSINSLTVAGIKAVQFGEGIPFLGLWLRAVFYMIDCVS